MKLFHISDVLCITTGRLVSRNGIGGVYAILNFLTGDNLFTHQIPRVSDECRPWLRTQFPQLFPEDPLMAKLLEDLVIAVSACNERTALDQIVEKWVETVRDVQQLPENLAVYEMGADLHTHIDPLEELEAMVGKDRIIKIKCEEE